MHCTQCQTSLFLITKEFQQRITLSFVCNTLFYLLNIHKRKNRFASYPDILWEKCWIHNATMILPHLSLQCCQSISSQISVCRPSLRLLVAPKIGGQYVLSLFWFCQGKPCLVAHPVNKGSTYINELRNTLLTVYMCTCMHVYIY